MRKRFEDAVKEFLVDPKMSAAGGVGLVMQVLAGEMRMKDRSIHIRGVEVKDFRLAMVDPDNGVEVLAHNDPAFDSESSAYTLSLTLSFRPHANIALRSEPIKAPFISLVEWCIL